MPDVDFRAAVLRPDDLLVLDFDFVNLQLDRDAGQPPRLRRLRRGEPAFVVVVLPPQHVAEQVMREEFIHPQAVIANPSRLAFRVDDDLDEVDFSLATLLDWSRHTLSVTANAAAGQPVPSPAPAAPEPHQTAIELPYRLVLSPDDRAGWAHAVGAVTREGVSELWHTRLGLAADGGVDETRLPVVRAVWARDLADDLGEFVDTSLTGGQRRAIVRQSADFTQFDDPTPLQARHLTLSALGAWADVRGDWDTADGEELPLESWRHVVAQGRDQFVRVVERGHLFPLGHRAVLVSVVERVLTSEGGIDLLTETVRRVEVRQPVRDYEQTRSAHPRNAQLPIRRARIQTLATPQLSRDDAPSGVPFVIAVDGVPFVFDVVGEDWAGGQVDLDMPLIFVPAGGGGSFPTLQGLYETHLRHIDLHNRPVALAPQTPNPGTTVLPVASMAFSAVEAAGADPPFLPFVESAMVQVPGANELVGSVSPVPPREIELVDPATSPGQVFARLREPLGLNLPTERAGGLARPNMSIGALSRELGAVPPALERLGTGQFQLSEVFSALEDAKLLGGISLPDVIGQIVNQAQLPGLSRRVTPSGVDIVFTWSPPLRPEAGPLKLHIGGTSTLTLRSEVHVPRGAPGKPRMRVEGVLTHFAIDFVNVVRLGFAELRFLAEDGRKIDVHPAGMRLELRNQLSFLNALADMVPSDGFSDPPQLRVTSEGVEATYSLGLPKAGLGIFSLEHVAFSAGIVLPFVGRPAAVRLAFSDRAHPFLTTVSMIGGGGYFAIEVDTTGIRRIEGAIEVGASLSVNLGIVSASAYVMGGFYFGLEAGGAIRFEAYLRIGGAVELLGVAGVSFEIYLVLEYQPGPEPRIGGRASVMVAVRLLMFTKTVRLSTEKHFAIPARDPSFDELVDEDDWETYCRAFA
ncbi:hypothetical protein [Streptoalloteichus hindustanus]|uniref:Uncharacterized protein n=1 Tax=Streptoalloteichus hindustanus TaxID=2017 RepID=A0A1M5CQA6_STRHI|nr:hypothetical protein [Streptoalloteichus hindustanus]SHF56797.1 hypothetical protein SAMN05444320_104118 [Streptoalloteichus hindustanus]